MRPIISIDFSTVGINNNNNNNNFEEIYPRTEKS